MQAQRAMQAGPVVLSGGAALLEWWGGLPASIRAAGAATGGRPHTRGIRETMRGAGIVATYRLRVGLGSSVPSIEAVVPQLCCAHAAAHDAGGPLPQSCSGALLDGLRAKASPT